MTTNNNINVAKNVAQQNSQDLTEQWKKGELENGEYFILTNSIIEKMEYKKEHNGFGFDEIGWVDEVLAPVSNYEEWKEMKEQRDACAWALNKIGDILVKHKLVKK